MRYDLKAITLLRELILGFFVLLAMFQQRKTIKTLVIHEIMMVYSFTKLQERVCGSRSLGFTIPWLDPTPGQRSTGPRFPKLRLNPAADQLRLRSSVAQSKLRKMASKTFEMVDVDDVDPPLVNTEEVQAENFLITPLNRSSRGLTMEGLKLRKATWRRAKGRKDS